MTKRDTVEKASSPSGRTIGLFGVLVAGYGLAAVAAAVCWVQSTFWIAAVVFWVGGAVLTLLFAGLLHLFRAPSHEKDQRYDGRERMNLRRSNENG